MWERDPPKPLWFRAFELLWAIVALICTTPHIFAKIGHAVKTLVIFIDKSCQNLQEPPIPWTFSVQKSFGRQQCHLLLRFRCILTLMDRVKKMWRQQHPVFPGGHPSKYWLGSTLLNFSDRTRTGVFSVIWPLAKEGVKIRLFELTDCLANWNSTSSDSSYEFRKMLTDSSSEVQH